MRFIILIIVLGICFKSNAQYSKGDSLRGTINENRLWWDVQHYHLNVEVDVNQKFIKGCTNIIYKTLTKQKKMQIDLQEPLQIDSVIFHSQKCIWKHNFNAWLIDLKQQSELTDSIRIYYSGKPRAAKFPPWDGGFSWKKDDKGRPWVGVSCQGLGASAWWPNKDHQYDEPDKGMQISITTADSLSNISNGKLVSAITNTNHTTTWNYQVFNPINNYDVTLNIGNFVTVKDSFIGKNGVLKMEYVVLDYNRSKIESHLKSDTHDMLKSFEYWFGSYPFYEDGFRLVETSYLGMEHQSAIAYGNKFKKGYLGTDRSRTGVGLLWDFIIVHESGHEWFGNNITCKDNADMWIHEGFTTYSEVLFMESKWNKDTAWKYLRGLRKNIRNDRPLIGNYGVNNEGSGDIYDKGANMIHNIRQVMDNDSLFHEILLAMNKDFAKKTVSTKEIEAYMIARSGKDLQPIFDQYLRTRKVPVLEYKIVKGTLIYKWTNCIKGFNMPVKMISDKNTSFWILPSTTKKQLFLQQNVTSLKMDINFYAEEKNVSH
ncbi:MAG: M1 family metallopeptidase [Bacteroidetes bacterium]|nr:M1 family metallopeptidase [Bacteroidota bacterium]